MTYDLHFVATAGDDEKPFGFGYRAAIAVAGPQKLVNRFVKCLLTPKGTDPTDENEGTTFMSLVGSNVPSSQYILDSLALTLDDAASQLRAFDRVAGLPSNEQFGSVSLLQLVERVAGGYDVWVLLRNAANEPVPVRLPTIGQEHA
jgi:hypothetical protein